MPGDMASAAAHAFWLLVEPARLMVLVIGVLIGLAIGVLPGLNGIVGMAMLIPFTYGMDQHTAMALLLGMAAVITSSDFISRGAVRRARPCRRRRDRDRRPRHGAQGRGRPRLRRGLRGLARGRPRRRGGARAQHPGAAPGAALDRLAGAPRLHAVRPLHGGDAVGPRAAQGAHRRRPRADDLDDRLALGKRHAALDLRHALPLRRRARWCRRRSACSRCRSCASSRSRARRSPATTRATSTCRASGRACATSAAIGGWCCAAASSAPASAPFPASARR